MKIRKLLSIFLTTIMLSATGSTVMTASATENQSDSLYILSDKIPESVTNYAINYFSGFTSSFLSDLGFTTNEMMNLRLSPGFTPYEYDKCDLPLYYYPVVNNDGIIAILKIVDHGYGEYSAQFGKSELSESLNTISNNETSPIALVISNEAMYALSENNTLDLMETFDLYNINAMTETFTLSSFNYIKPNIEFSEINFTNGEVIEVLYNTIYDATITYSPNIARNAASNKALNVPFVNNGTTEEYSNGICWASAAASVIKYRANPSDSAITIRDNIVNKGYDASHPNITKKMAAEIKAYVGSSQYTTTLSFTTVKSKINNDIPLYTRWGISGGGGHALVMRSYVVDSNGNESVGFMDPNYSYYTAMTFGSSFSNGTKIYTWTNTIY